LAAVGNMSAQHVLYVFDMSALCVFVFTSEDIS